MLISALYRITHTWGFTLLVGMLLGAVLVSSMSLVFWSLTPTAETVLIPRRKALLSPLPGVHKEQVMLKDVGESGGERIKRDECSCAQQSNVVESKLRDSAEEQGNPSIRDTQPLTHNATPILRAQPASDTRKVEELKQDHMMKQRPETAGIFPGQVGGGVGRDRILTSLNGGKKIIDSLLVAVFIDGSRLEWAESVYETWGRDTSHLVFYTVQDSKIKLLQTQTLGIDVVKLPTSSAAHTRLLLLQHLGEHYMESQQWFVVVTENTYVRMDQLDATLKRERADVPLVLGSRSHCLIGGTGGGNSLVLNQALLALLTPHIQNCLSEVADGMGSAGVEQCVDNYLKVQCSPSQVSGGRMICV